MAIRVIVAGAGARGRDWVREVRANPAFELSALVDPDHNTLAAASRSFAISESNCFSLLEVALDQKDCDAVIIASSADRHVQVCELAVSRRRAVMVEKPFTMALVEAIKLVSLAEQQKVPLIVAQNYRYLRSFRTARRMIAEGALGRVGLVVCQYYRVPHTMVASLASLPHSVLWGVGVHHLDALRYILGQNIERVMADSFNLPWGQSPEGASMVVMLGFENRTRGNYLATYESSGHEFFEGGQEFYARFVGERATLHVFQRWLMLYEGNKLPRLIRRGSRETTEEQVLLRQLEGALLRGEEPDSSGRDNLQTVATIEACVRSVAEQRWIALRELFDESR